MSYPKKDGNWNVYILQSQYEKKEKNGWSTYTWVDKYDTRERAEAMGFKYEEVTLRPSGNVWQQSGIHGTVCLEYIQALLRLSQRHEPSHKHRIVRLWITRATQILVD